MLHELEMPHGNAFCPMQGRAQSHTTGICFSGGYVSTDRLFVPRRMLTDRTIMTYIIASEEGAKVLLDAVLTYDKTKNASSRT